MLVHNDLEDDELELEDAAPRERVLRPVGRPRGSRNLVPTEDTTLVTPATAMIARAAEALDAAIENDEGPARIQALGEDLVRIRREAEDADAAEDEVRKIKDVVTRRKAHAAAEARIVAGQTAARAARAESTMRITAQGAGVIVRAYPSRVADPVAKSTCFNTMKTVSTLIWNVEEKRIAAERIRGEGKTPAAPQSQEWLVNQIRDIARWSIHLGLITIESTDAT